jgi:ABC-type lipoprotein export system ATPase subunit
MFSLKENIAFIVARSDVSHDIMLYITISIILSIVGFCEVYYMGKILDGSISVWNCLIIIGIIKAINPSIEYMNEITYMNINNKLHETSQRYYWGLTLSAIPTWLPKNKNIQNSISSGIEAIKNTIVSIATLSRPTFRLISSMFYMIMISPHGFYGVVVILIIISTGIYITSENFNKRKEINEKHKESVEIAEDQSKNLLIRILNNKGKQTVNNIIQTYMDKNNDFRIHKITEHQGLALIGTIGSILQLSMVAYLIYITGDINLTPSIYITMERMYSASFSIIQKLNIISVRASKWSSMEKCLKTYETYKRKEFAINISDIIPDDVYEIQLYGPSGCGKTSFMRNKVIELFMNSYPGQFIYMDQHMRLIITDRSILSIMSDDLQSPNMMDINTLLHYSKMLAIDNKINIDTSHKPFDGVSGGEEKRIMTLRAWMPLLIGVSKVKVIFNDEITAGLDYDNWGHVRCIVNILKKTGVQFVTIDHHPMDVLKRRVYTKVKSNGESYYWV